MFGGWKINTKRKYKYGRGKKFYSYKKKKKSLARNKSKKYNGGTSENCNSYGFSGNSDALGMVNLRI